MRAMRLMHRSISGRVWPSSGPRAHPPRPLSTYSHSTAAATRQSPRLLRTAAGNSGRLYILDILPFAHRCVASAEKSIATQISAQMAALANPQGTMNTDTKKSFQPPGLAAHKFIELLLELLSRVDGPTHVAAVVDVPGQMNFRHQMLPSYKGHRAEKPPNLYDELSRMLVMIEAMGIPILSVPGVEADDVCGALAVKAVKDGFDIVLVSPDRDFYQLLQPGLSLLKYTKTGPQLYTHHDWAQEFTLPADQAHLWVDVRALGGDPGDNIPGVKGIGMTTALQLVREFGSVEHILEVVEKGQVHEQAKEPLKLRKSQEQMLASPEGVTAAKFCKKLITIVTEMKLPPLRQSWDVYKLNLGPENAEAVVEVARAMQLHWIAAELVEFYRANAER